MPDFNATVLIATYNRAHLLPRCLESVLAQRLEPRQIIVVDDGCTDGTVEALDHLTESEERLFRLRRMAMMAMRELWDEATADLAAFASAVPGTDQIAPSAQERRLLRLATADRYGAAPRLDRRRIAAVRRAAPGRRYAGLRASLRHGLWQSAVTNLCKRRPVSAARMLILAARLLP